MGGRNNAVDFTHLGFLLSLENFREVLVGGDEAVILGVSQS